MLAFWVTFTLVHVCDLAMTWFVTSIMLDMAAHWLPVPGFKVTET